MSSSDQEEIPGNKLESNRFQLLWQTAPVTTLLIVVNLLVFLAMVYRDKSSFFLPAPELLVDFGANHALLLAEGEWWRLLTYQFVHGGIIHLGFNMLALGFLGMRIEPPLKKMSFLLLYIVSGVGAGLASSLWHKSISVGASGAIFGILGYGFVLERLVMRHIQKTYGQKMRRGQYTGLVVANLILGVVVSSGGMIGIDNAAHLGGLITGSLLTLALLYAKRNDLVPQNKVKSLNLAFFIFLALVFCAYQVSQSNI